MKKALIVLAVLLLAVPAALAENNTGCGLGTMIFGDQADGSILLQSLAVTTNGTSGNQTFGITSGTSECEQPAAFVYDDRVKDYIRDNMDTLAKDISRGGGETLGSLAELMEVDSAKRSGFYAALQQGFGEIFPGSDVDFAHVADSIARIAKG